MTDNFPTVGGRVGISGSTAASRHMLGSESAKGLGVGREWSTRESHASLFHKQLGRSDSSLTSSSMANLLKPSAALAHMQKRVVGRTQQHHRIHGGLQSNSVLGSSASWRFLKEGVAHSDGSALHSFAPLPTSIPLTAEGRAYLEQYERSQALQTPKDHPTFIALLEAQQAETAREEELRVLHAEHSAFQHAHGLIPFEQYVHLRHTQQLQQYVQQLQQQQQQEKEKDSSRSDEKETFTSHSQPHPPSHPRPRPPSYPHPSTTHQQQQQDEQWQSARASLRANFIPAVAQRHHQPAVPAIEKGSRNEFLNQVASVESHKAESNDDIGGLDTPTQVTLSLAPFQPLANPSQSLQNEEQKPGNLADVTYTENGVTTTIHGTSSVTTIPNEPSHTSSEETQKVHEESLRERLSHVRGRTRERESKPGTAATAGGFESARGGGGSSNGSSRSSSQDSESGPVILWRATNRVKEAIDVPAELRSVFLQEPSNGDGDEDLLEGAYGEDGESLDPSHPSFDQPLRVSYKKSAGIYAPQQLSPLEKLALARARNHNQPPTRAMAELEYNLHPKLQAERLPEKRERLRKARRKAAHGGAAAVVAALLSTKPPPPDSSFTVKPRASKPAKSYGHWYLPTSLWIAEDKPTVRSHISARSNTLKPHMHLGTWSSAGTSLHGANTLDVGQAEWEEIRNKMGQHRSGLPNWHELKAGLAAGTLPSHDGVRTIQGSGPTEEEEDEMDVASKVNQIKAQALESRNRRRRIEAAKKIEHYQHKRLMKQHARQHRAGGGFFGKGVVGSDDDELPPEFSVGEGDSAELDRIGSNPLLKATATAASSPHAQGTSKLPKSMEEQYAMLKDQLSHLPIAAELKWWIQKNGGRTPHFLHAVDASAVEAAATREHLRQPPPLLDETTNFGATGTLSNNNLSNVNGNAAAPSGTFRQNSHSRPAAAADDEFGSINTTSGFSSSRGAATSRTLSYGLGQRVPLNSSSSGALTDRTDHRFQ